MANKANSANDDLVLKGILNGANAFAGPGIVQFDITNRCNNNCVCCWNNSPYLGEQSEEKNKEKQYELPFDLIKRALDELKEIGTKTIFLAGGGEPFMHNNVMDILECIKSNGMRVCINTNFTLLDEEKIRKLIQLKVDHIHVSMLAGNSKSYCLMHPNKTEETFFRIKSLLKYLVRLKEETGQPIQPHINMYYVMCNANYLDVKEMVDLALEVKANSLEFTPVDTIPEKTDVLLLSGVQKEQLFKEVVYQNGMLKKYNEQHEGLVTFIEQYDSFIKRISVDSAKKGHYEIKTVPSQPCYAGWGFLRILASGEVNPCLKAHRISVGNLYKNSIKEIWNSKEEQLFRKHSFKLDKNDPYFKMIGNNPDCSFGCLASCDNIQINFEMHEKYADILKQYGRIK
jgi:MoaA/NifB/PqqE/SkfB family radical SAM enzyme